MVLSALALLAQATLPAAAPPAPLCRARQLRVSLTPSADANGMSHAGAELSLRNVGPDCTLPALPPVSFRDARGRLLPLTRQAPVGMHPGPVMVPVRLGGGHRAATLLRWIAGPVFPHNRVLHAASVSVTIAGTTLRAPAQAAITTEAGKPGTFDQPPLRAMEDMAAG